MYTLAHRVLNAVKLQDEFDLLVMWSMCWGKGFSCGLLAQSPVRTCTNLTGYGKSGLGQSSIPRPKSPTTKESIQRALWQKFSHSWYYRLSAMWEAGDGLPCTLRVQVFSCDF